MEQSILESFVKERRQVLHTHAEPKIHGRPVLLARRAPNKRDKETGRENKREAPGVAPAGSVPGVVALWRKGCDSHFSKKLGLQLNFQWMLFGRTVEHLRVRVNEGGAKWITVWVSPTSRTNPSCANTYEAALQGGNAKSLVTNHALMSDG